MTTAEILNRAADLCDGTWGQGMNVVGVNPDDPSTCFCASTAIGAACGSDIKRWAQVYSVLELSIGCDPVDWNDYPGRTQAEVVRALRDAAKVST